MERRDIPKMVGIEKLKQRLEQKGTVADSGRAVTADDRVQIIGRGGITYMPT